MTTIMRTVCNAVESFRFPRLALALGASGFVLMALALACNADELDAKQAGPSASIPMSEIGTAAGRQYTGDGLSVSATDGGAHLRCLFQRLEGEATSEGLWLVSTAESRREARFSVKAVGLGRDQTIMGLSECGRIVVTDNVARWIRPGLIEEYSSSMDGVRQDFVITEKPSSAGSLRVELSVTGAKVEPAGDGVALVLEQTGRRLTYGKLKATDAVGKELAAWMTTIEESRLAIVVEDAEAAYPIRIDPTFSDANWVGMGGEQGVNSNVYAIVVDTNAGIVYVGGEFTAAAGIPAKYIAKWNGSVWSALGSGLNGIVRALVMDSTGSLYVGGQFSNAGGVSANNITKWNGSVWSALGAGTSSTIYALALDGSGNLYAGGTFTNAGGVSANRIAKWDGSAWSALGLGMSNTVYALAYGGSGNLYAGGTFTNAGGVSANKIAKWDGNAWSALGSGMSILLNPYNSVYALVLDGSGNLYAGGYFTTAGGIAVGNIAKWDGSAWSALGAGTSSIIYALALDGSSNLYVAGDFTVANHNPANKIAKWNGSTWSTLASGMNSYAFTVYALGLDGSGNLYAGGYFTTAGDVSANYIAKWDGSLWIALGSGLHNFVFALAPDSMGNLYVGGYFTSIGTISANRIAKWDGSAWSALGSGMNGNVRALKLDGSGNLYVGGAFSTAGDVSVTNIAKWTGNAWSSLGSGVNYSIYALACDGVGNLYAGGEAGGGGGIAKWDGSAWNTLGSGLDSFGEIRVLAADSSGNLYAGGWWSSIGGNVSAQDIAKWDGSTWSALGSGMIGSVYALALDNSGNLYAGGTFTSAGGVSVNRIAKWNGSAWSALGSGINGSDIHALATDGSGNLYVGGAFITAGDVPAINIAKWNGNAWSTLGSGVNSRILALALDGAGNLYAGGEFTTAGTNVSAYVARAILPPKEHQTITFSPIPDQLETNTVRLSATASSGYAVTFTVTNGPGTISGGTNLSFTSTGIVSVVASQAGNGDWYPASAVTNTFEVFAFYALNVTAENGSVVKVPDTPSYSEGSTISLTAIPNAGYRFTDWSGNAAGTNNPVSVTMDSDKSVTAHFVLNVITVLTDRVSMSVPEGGTTNFQVKLNAQPTGDTGVAVARISGDPDITVSGGASLTFSTANWDAWQTVTLSAAEDNEDNRNGAAAIACSGIGITNATVQAAEIDDDYRMLVIDEWHLENIWGSNGSGDGQFNLENGIAVETNGLIYVADTGNHRIQVFQSNGTFVRTWGSQGSGDGQFSFPYGIIAGTNGLIYVADTMNHRIQVFQSDGTFVRKWGSQGAGDGQFNGPRAITVDTNGLIYVADTMNHRIQVFQSDGAFVRKWGSQGSGDGQFSIPCGIVAGTDGLIYVADTGNHRIQVFEPDGTFVSKWGSPGSGDGQFNGPRGITMGTDDLIYVADTGNNRIQVFMSDGMFVTKWGTSGSGGGQFSGVCGIVQGTNGLIYVADRLNYRIQVLHSAINGTVVKTPDSTLYDRGTAVSLEAIPNTDSHFTGWSGDVTGTNNPVSVIMDADKRMTAGFALNVITVLTDRAVISIPEGGSTNFQIKLSAQPTGDTVVAVGRIDGDTDISVSGDGLLTFTTGNWADYQTVTVVAGEDNSDNSNGVTILSCSGTWLTRATVEATEIDDDHTLMVTAENGAVTKAPDTPYYDNGSSVSLTAIPNMAFHFIDWSGGASGSANPVSVIITSNTSMTANFALNVITVLTDRTSGSVPEGGSTNFQVKLSAQPTGDTVVAVAQTSGDTDITVSGGASLTFSTANWDTYQAVALTASEDNDDNQNGTATITCSGSGVSNATVTATEADDDFVLTVISLYGTVTLDPETPYYDNGTVATLTATPDAPYYFTGWTGDLTGPTNPSAITMDGNKIVTANYGPVASVVLPPKTIGKKNFTARWKWVEGGAPEGELDVASDVAFTQFVPGYEARYVVNSTECLVTNLLAGKDYRYRIRRLMPDGSFGPWSPAMRVKTGLGMPVFKNLLSDVPTAKDISQQFAVSNLVAGTGTLRVKSSNTNAVKATIASGVLTLQYLWKATNSARVTLTLTHPPTRYKASYGAALSRATGTVYKVGQTALTNAGTRVAQEVTFENRTGRVVYGIRVRAMGLDNTAWLINRTGLDPVSKASIREIPCVLPAGSQMVVRLVYNIAYKTQSKTRPVTYGAWAIMTPVSGAGPVNGAMTIRQRDLYDGLWLLGLPANRNRLYTVYHSDDEGASWTLNVPVIRATTNYLMWLDTDDGAPEGRLYRVVDAGL